MGQAVVCSQTGTLAMELPCCGWYLCTHTDFLRVTCCTFCGVAQLHVCGHNSCKALRECDFAFIFTIMYVLSMNGRSCTDSLVHVNVHADRHTL